MAKAYFGAGCFWGVEATFRRINGVVGVTVGYQGGTTKNPSYEEVCSGSTGHAEAVEVVYDAAKVSYEELLQNFWLMHDPTTLNRQGFDVGTQYRSVVFALDPEQAAAAERDKEKFNTEQKFHKPVVTEIVTPAPPFFRAEDYHQRYFEKQGRAL